MFKASALELSDGHRDVWATRADGQHCPRWQYGLCKHSGMHGCHAVPCCAKLHLGSSAASVLHHHHGLGHLPTGARGPHCSQMHPVGDREPLARPPQGMAGDCLNPTAPRGQGGSARARESPSCRAGEGRALQAAARCQPRGTRYSRCGEGKQSEGQGRACSAAGRLRSPSPSL